MSEHDLLCPWQTRTCECPLIERVTEREHERWNFMSEAEIRADERMRTPVVYERDLTPMADLRAKVEALLKEAERMEWDRDAWLAMAYRDVLALMGGGK